VKAIILKNFGSVDNFELVEVENPKVSYGEVLVKIKATAFNPIDYQMRQGGIESKLLKSPILGRELAGVVEAIGKDVTGFAAGDNVAAYVGSLASNGTYAEYISIPQQLIAKVPASISVEKAAALPMVGMTALQCFERLAVSKNDFVFVSGGAGGVGTILIQLLLSKGVQVLTTAGNIESRDHLLRLGVPESDIMDYRQPDLQKHINEKVNHRPFDFCIDLVGGSMSEICAELIKVNGTYADVTYLATEKAKGLLFDKATNIVNVANYAYALTGGSAGIAYYGIKLTALFKMITDKLISAPAVQVVGGLQVESVKLAHQLLEENQTKGKKLIMLNAQ
jgi:NADPH:quinone reductase-like Zn-dependent oxidoreductase